MRRITAAILCLLTFSEIADAAPRPLWVRRVGGRMKSSSTFVNATSIDLNGTTKYLEAASDAASMECTTQFTAAWWMKLDTAATSKAVWSKWLASTQNTIQAWLGTSSGTTYNIDFYVANALTDSGGQRCRLSNVLNQGQWHHIIFTYDGTQTGNDDRVDVYVDGVDSGCTFAGTIPAALTDGTHPWDVGAYRASGAHGGFFGPGNVDEVAWWCSGKAQAADAACVYNGGKAGDLAACTGLTSMIAWWRFESSLGDSSTNVDNKASGATVDLTPVAIVNGDFVADVP